MKVITIIVLSFLLLTHVSNSDEVKLPFDKENIKAIYKINNGNLIYIQSFERGDIIWEKEKHSKELKEISFVWNFIALAEKCEYIKKDNIYFATNLEYWFGGGTNIDYPEIRIFDLYEPKPWIDSDLGITPDMEYAKQWCKFYKEQ